jgi:hypothetical protein
MEYSLKQLALKDLATLSLQFEEVQLSEGHFGFISTNTILHTMSNCSFRYHVMVVLHDTHLLRRPEHVRYTVGVELVLAKECAGHQTREDFSWKNTSLEDATWQEYISSDTAFHVGDYIHTDDWKTGLLAGLQSAGQAPLHLSHFMDEVYIPNVTLRQMILSKGTPLVDTQIVCNDCGEPYEGKDNKCAACGSTHLIEEDEENPIFYMVCRDCDNMHSGVDVGICEDCDSENLEKVHKHDLGMFD